MGRKPNDGEWTRNSYASEWRPRPGVCERIRVVRIQRSGLSAVMWRTDDGPEDGAIVRLDAVSVPAAEEEALAKYREWLTASAPETTERGD